jgi:hypothetical protein
MIKYSMVLRSTQTMSIAEDCVNKLGSLLFSALHQLYDAYIERAQMQLAPLARALQSRGLEFRHLECDARGEAAPSTEALRCRY